MIHIISRLATSFADSITAGKIGFISEERLQNLADSSKAAFSAVAPMHPVTNAIAFASKIAAWRNEGVEPEVAPTATPGAAPEL